MIGVSASDDDATRSQKVTLTLASMMVAALAVAWVGTYWALGLPLGLQATYSYP